MASTALKGTPIQTSGDLPALGSNAPDFRLVDTELSEVSLGTYSGRKVLNIFPSIDTSVCATSVRTFNERAGRLDSVTVLNRLPRPPVCAQALLRSGRARGRGEPLHVPRHVSRGLRREDGGRPPWRASRPARWSCSTTRIRWCTPSWFPRSRRSPTTRRRSRRLGPSRPSRPEARRSATGSRLSLTSTPPPSRIGSSAPGGAARTTFGRKKTAGGVQDDRAQAS